MNYNCLPLQQIRQPIKMENEKKYFAFISYKREDEKWAKWLQHKLEHYKLPSNLNGKTNLPKEIRPIFRDQSELAAGVLADEIKKALTDSKYLIIICSPRAAQSQWVGKEVQTFIDLGRTDKIIPFIIGGTAHAQNPEDECFPLALLNLPPEQELLGVNIDEMGRDAAVVKVVAQLFGLKFDLLWQRYEREQKRKRYKVIIIGVVALIAMAWIAIWMYLQRQQTMTANWKMKETQSRFVAKVATELMEVGDSYQAQIILLDALPRDLKKLDRPCVAEAELALRKAHYLNSCILKGHSDQVNMSVFSPDGSSIVSASDDSTLVLWNIGTGKSVRAFIGHCGKVRKVCFDPNGKLIASISTDSTLRIWDVETAQEKQVIKCENSVFQDCIFDHNGSRVYTSNSYDRSICIWDTRTGEKLQTISISENSLTFLSFSLGPNCRNVISRTLELYCEVIDVFGGGNRIKVPNGNMDFNGDGTKLITRGEVGDYYSLVIWDVNTGDKLVSLKDPLFNEDNSVNHVAYSQNGEFVAACSYKNVFVWRVRYTGFQSLMHMRMGNIQTKNLLQSKADRIFSYDQINSISFSPDGKTLVCSCTDGTVKKWEVDEMRPDFVIENNVLRVRDASIGYNGERILIISAIDKKINIINVKTGDTIIAFYVDDAGDYSDPKIVANPCDNTFLTITSEDKSISVWDMDSCQIICKLTGHISTVTSVMYSMDGKYIISSSMDGSVRLWDAVTFEMLKVFDFPDAVVTSVIISPDGKRFAELESAHTIKICDVESGEVLQVFNGYFIRPLTFSPNGEMIAISCSDNHQVMVLDVKTGEIIRSMKGSNAVFTPDKKIITSSLIMDIKTGLSVPISVGEPMAFFPDGRHFLALSYENLEVWDFPPLQDLIDQTRERFKDRPLTPEERHQYYLE